MLSVNYVRQNLVSFTILLFFCLFLFTVYVKPRVIYNKNGTLKQFGIGYKNKTIFPLWLVSILYAITSYFIVLLYISFNKLVY
jgi:hypothetical protein